MQSTEVPPGLFFFFWSICIRKLVIGIISFLLWNVNLKGLSTVSHHRTLSPGSILLKGRVPWLLVFESAASERGSCSRMHSYPLSWRCEKVCLLKSQAVVQWWPLAPIKQLFTWRQRRGAAQPTHLTSCAYPSPNSINSREKKSYLLRECLLPSESDYSYISKQTTGEGRHALDNKHTHAWLHCS